MNWTQFQNGFSWAAGFMVIAALCWPIYYVVTRRMLSELGKLSSVFEDRKLRRRDGVSVADVSFRRGSDDDDDDDDDGFGGAGSIRVLGRLINQGSEAWGDIQLTIDLLDVEGRFLDQETEQIEGALEPGETRRFAFDLYPDVAPAAVEVRVVGGDHLRDEDAEDEG